MGQVLTLSNIDVRYTNNGESLTILDQANFTLHRGEMVALVAPSGTGKSTLLHVAGLLERPTSGDVILCGQSCNQLNDNKRTALRCSHIGFVYQFHHLLPEFTALENVMIPQMIAGLTKKTAQKRAFQLLEYLHIGHRATHRPSALSGGERQRVAIARAVANAPLILLADEPTGNLDPKTSDYVFKALSELVSQAGFSALIATHNHEIAQKMHRTISLRAGRIIELN